MAVDTENKRRSVIANLPEPDGAIESRDRAQTAWNYAGLYYLLVLPVFDVIISDAAAYALTISDAAAYGLTVSDAAAYGLTINDTAAYALTASDSPAYDLTVSETSRS